MKMKKTRKSNKIPVQPKNGPEYPTEQNSQNIQKVNTVAALN